MNRITLLTLVTLLTFAQLGAGMTLAEAVAIGKKRSLAQVKPQLDQDRVKGQVIEAWSNALPQVEGTVGYQRAIKPTKFFFPDESGNLQAIEIGADNAIQADVTLNQPLLTFGRVAAGLRGAYAAKRANEHMITQNTRNVEYEVMTRFWSVLLLRDVVKAREASLSISDSSLTRAQLMKEVGLMSDYDVLRVRVQAENQKPQLQDAQKNLRLAELSLKEYLGVPLDTTITFDGSLEDFHFEVDSSDVQKQIQSRDDLEALRHLSDMQKNIYVIFRNAHWPTLGGQLKYSWQWQNNEWDINPRNNVSSLYAGVGLTIPIMTSGGQYGKAKQYKADWLTAQLNLHQAERGAQLQYESAKRDLNTAIERESAARTAVELATTAREIAQTKFGQGQLTPLEMDAAQLDELVARVSLAQAIFERLAASAELRLALGDNPYNQ